MVIQPRFQTTSARPQQVRSAQAGPVDGLASSQPSPENAKMDQLRQMAQSQPAPWPQLTTAPPSSWPSEQEVQDVLKTAVCNVPEKVRTGVEAEKFDNFIREQITTFQERKAAAEGTGEKSRLVHREQLHGGAAQIHWNPNLEKFVNLFGTQPSNGLVRISDAAAGENPDGKSMFGFALEFKGPNGDPTDILLTGGTPRTEASQARDPEAQLALFNMLNPASKVGGIGRILWDVGPISGPKMLLDVARMRTDLDSLSDLTAWSRAPFGLQSKDGKQYVVKMRVVPVDGSKDVSPGPEGETSSQRLSRRFSNQLSEGEARWRLELQFMQPGESADDPRDTWKGDWLAAGEVVLPKSDETSARYAEAAEATKFNPWKGKEPTSRSSEKFVFRPWGEMNRARLVAYQTSAGNRE